MTRALDLARRVGEDPWQYALEMEVVYRAGLEGPMLRYLIVNEYVKHGYERTRRKDGRRRFEPAGSGPLTGESVFLATDELLPFLANLQGETPEDGAGHAIDPGGPRRITLGAVHPRWDKASRRLYVGEELVMWIRWRAPSQELLLQAFHEAGWPEWLDDPLPPKPGIVQARRVADLVWKLNRNQLVEALEFHSARGGTQITCNFRPKPWRKRCAKSGTGPLS